MGQQMLEWLPVLLVGAGLLVLFWSAYRLRLEKNEDAAIAMGLGACAILLSAVWKVGAEIGFWIVTLLALTALLILVFALVQRRAPSLPDATGVWKPLLAAILALLALGGYAWLTYFLLNLAGINDETRWARSIYLYAGVEAVAFAAAGFFFGTEVNRQRAEMAERRADEAIRAAAAAEAEVRAARQEATETRAVLIDALKQTNSGG